MDYQRGRDSGRFRADDARNAYAREHWDGNNWVDDTEFEDKIETICKNKTEGYVVFIDIHD